MEDLVKLMNFLFEKYELKNQDWLKLNNSNLYNGNQKVCHIINDSNIMNYIRSYRDFLNNMNDLQFDLSKLKLSCKISSRVKDNNSLQDKMNRYMGKKHENGEVPLNKCINDILGFRIIFNEDYSHEELENILKNNFNNIKVINGNKGDYKALHAYFKTGNNKNFRWELQMWNKSDEELNLISHYKYKQDYIKWEYEGKEGD